jgi:hypothetical protein
MSPLTGLPILLPNQSGLAGLGVTWSSPSESTLNAHGSLDRPLGTAVTTDSSGVAATIYTPMAETGDQTGSIESEPALVFAEVQLVDLVAANYLLHPALRGFVVGSRMAHSVLTIEWHEEGSHVIDGARNGSQVHGQKCDGIDGQWVVDGTYSRSGFDGTQQWVITLSEASMTGTFTYTDHQVGVQVGVTITTEGSAEGTVTASIDEEDNVLMHLTETRHTFRSSTSVGGQGADQNAPLADYDFAWEPAPPC